MEVMQFILGFTAGIMAGFVLRGMFDALIIELRHIGNTHDKANRH